MEQLTLKTMIEKLEQEIEKCTEREPSIIFDFCRLYPDCLDSYRGYYCDLAIGYTHDTAIKATEFLEMLVQSENTTFEGWKGGDFKMDANTIIWAANPGRTGDTKVVGVKFDGWHIVIQTEHEYE